MAPLLLLSLIAASPTLFVNSSGVNVRAGPSTRDPVVFVVPYGTLCTKKQKKKDWLEVAMGEQTGWLKETFLETPPKQVPKKDRAIINAFKKTLSYPNDFADQSIPIRFFGPEPCIPGLECAAFTKKARSAIERWIYWEEVPIKYHLWLMELSFVEKLGSIPAYAKTPVDLLNRSKVFRIPAARYNRAHPGALRKGRKVKQPRIRSSLFQKPPVLQVVSATGKKDRYVIEQPQAALVRLLQIYFAEENPFHFDLLQNIAYVAKKQIPILVLSKDRAVPLQAKVIHRISSLELVTKPVSSAKKTTILFGSKELLSNIAKKTIKKRKKQRAITVDLDGDEMASTASTFEYDFDGDGVVDLVESHERCPAEAGDSSDIVDYINVEGRFVGSLRTRSWCRP